MAAEFLAEYKAELRRLVRNEKTQINTLSMLAEANQAYADGIVVAIEQHILTCPAPAKLPALYLMDSILKNVGEPYKTMFAVRLAEVFGAVWDAMLPDKHASLSRLYGTWTGVLPASVLAQVQQRMVSPSNGLTQHAAPAAAAPQQQQPNPVFHQLQPQPQAVQLPQAQPPYGQIQIMQQPQQFVPIMGLPHQGGPTTFLQIGNSLVPVSALPGQPLMQPIVMQPAPPPPRTTPQHTMMQHTTPQHVMQAAGLPPVSPGHTAAGWQPQQQQAPHVLVGPGPMLRRSPGSPGSLQADLSRGPPPPRTGRASGSCRSASPLPSSAELTSSALDNLLSNLARSGVLAGSKTQEAAAAKTTEFQPAFLKELHPAVLQQLETDSAVMRPKFRDVEFQRNKRRGAAAGAAISRSWYLPVDAWIAGTTAHDEAAVHNPFGDDEAAAGSEDDAPPPAEPEDPDQTCCAISGEPFDKFYDQDAEGWFYRGVRRITGQEAARYGVPDGSLVKVKCLAEAGLGSGAAAMLAAAAAAGASGAGAGADGAADDDQQQQQQHEEAMMAAAAAAAPAATGGAAGSSSVPAAAAAAAAAAAGGSMEEEEEEAEDFGLDEYAGLAAAHGDDGGTAAEQMHVLVKPEPVLQQEGVKPEVKPDSDSSAAAAAVEGVGAKREAAAAGGADDNDTGSAAKKPRVAGMS